MEALYSVNIDTIYGKKQIAVYHCDATAFDEPIDILTISAFHRNYVPTPRTLIHALLKNCRISVEALAGTPEFDLRKTNQVWLSYPLTNQSRYGRIGCVEMLPLSASARQNKGHHHQNMILRGIKSYFQMLDLAATTGVKMDTVAVPFLGSGSQNIDQELIKIPLIHECIESLKRNPSIHKIIFLEMSPAKAFSLASTLEKSYAVKSESSSFRKSQTSSLQTGDKKKAFISYSTKDKEAADMLCTKLENAGVSVWYAPRDIVKDDYASSIVSAIMDSSCFITIVSKHSMDSQHVLNEIDVAFKRVHEGKSMIPVRIDDVELIPAFEYYLSRFQWMDASTPPTDLRLDEVIERILK